MTDRIVIGDTILGFAGGHFGRDSHDDKIVTAVGPDWIVCRYKDTNIPVFASGGDIHRALWHYCDRNPTAPTGSDQGRG